MEARSEWLVTMASGPLRGCIVCGWSLRDHGSEGQERCKVVPEPASAIVDFTKQLNRWIGCKRNSQFIGA